MNLFFIKETDNLTDVIVKDNKIIEFYDTEIKNEYYKRIFVFDPENNTKQEILPKVKKRNLVSIVDGVWKSKNIYFSTFTNINNKNNIKIKIHKYSIENNTDTVIYTFNENRELLNTIKTIKVFILNDTHIIIQSEIEREVASKHLMGSIDFSQVLINLENNTICHINNPNIANNGINVIIPVSESKILIKTGYSYLEDDRLDRSSENEALIESVFITTSAKFIADITLMSDVIDMELIASAYFVKHITVPKVTDDYIHFGIVDINNGVINCIFYNIKTEERKEYQNPIINSDDIYLTYIINNIPYVRIDRDNGVDFFNIKNIEIDVSFYNESLICQVGRLFIVRRNKKKVKRIRIYNYPKLKLIHTANEYFHLCCRIDNNYYIYTGDKKGIDANVF